MPYAISYEDDMKRQKSVGVGVADCSRLAIRSEPVVAVDKLIKGESYRCGAGSVTNEHVKKCPAANHTCENSDITGHLAK